MAADLLDNEVGLAKSPPTIRPWVYHGSLGLLILLNCIGWMVAGIVLGRYFQSSWIEAIGRGWGAGSSGLVQRFWDRFLVQRGYRLPGKTEPTTTTREVWGHSTALPRPQPPEPVRLVWGREAASATASGLKGKASVPDAVGLGLEPIVVRADIRLLASLGAICLVLGLMVAAGILAEHAAHPNAWPTGLGWLYAVGLVLAVLGGLGFWFGFGGRWETQVDNAGITRVRLDWTRFTPWSLVGSVVVVRQTTVLGPSLTLTFRDHGGRPLWSCAVDRRQWPGSERILPLARLHLPYHQIDPLADEAINL